MYKSSVDQSYQQYGAYYDHVKKKLEFQNQPKSKVKVRINSYKSSSSSSSSSSLCLDSCHTPYLFW